MPKPSITQRYEAELRTHAMSLPEAYEEFPWGERAIKVKAKVFLFMRADSKELHMSTKLPLSSEAALMFEFAAPTGYGLGKAGWVSARFGEDDAPPVALLKSWIDESYRAVAPKKLVASLGGEAMLSKPKTAKPKATKRKTAEPTATKRKTAKRKRSS